MSTKFTKSPRAQFELVDSHCLSLVKAMGGLEQRLIDWLLQKLSEDGFEKLTASQLSFLGALDCGSNYASEIARGMGISRQAVYKTIKELEKSGWLETKTDEARANQRLIIFTVEGERMMALARKHFARLDEELLKTFTAKNLSVISRFMDFAPPPSTTPSKK